MSRGSLPAMDVYLGVVGNLRQVFGLLSIGVLIGHGAVVAGGLYLRPGLCHAS
jgi:hypothetical protein